MRLLQNTMSNPSNFLLLPIPEIPMLDYLHNRNVKIVVLGARRVGKTALIVRFLTKRFIGDYEPNTGALYSRSISIDGDQISLQVQDTPCINQADGDDSSSPDIISRSLHWADGFVFVFSLTDTESWKALRPLHQQIRKIYPNTRLPFVLIGNKADLPHARQVETSEGIQLVNEIGGTYFEVSARENYNEVYDAFHQVCQEVCKVIGNNNGEKRRGLLLGRPKSPNMQDLGRRLKQALSSKVKSTASV
ncbi:ras-like protein family member 11A-like isoform X1 [Hemiscyllium ocellatum]|uniref:ras-like protein family member 11A-like isoform X1 n=2 Tax=Hemiscyllium ocellatum TaxID=170820 RepID=UPI002965DD0F|nr:ras-like protein family member 11A-like isoform X1 [Hemiscyllium ocellatum]